MVALRDIILRKQKEADKKADAPYRYRAVLTDITGAQTSTNPLVDVWANQTEKLVYHVPYGAGSPAPIYCYIISDPYVGLPVFCGYRDGSDEIEVLRVDPLPAKVGGNPSGYDSTSPEDLEPGGKKMMWTYTKTITPLATYPNLTGLLVNVIAGDYAYGGVRVTFAGQNNIALTQNPNPGEHYFAGLYLDSANALQVVYGASITTASEPPEPAWPAGAFRLSVVRVNDTQTSITFAADTDTANDVLDRRMPWSDENSGSAGWPYTHVLTVSATDPDAAYTTIPLAIAAASDGDTILVDAETISISTTITVNKALTITSLGGTVITSSVAGPTFELTDAAGATLENLTIRNTGAGAKSGCVKWAVADVIIRNCLIEKLSGASTVGYCLYPAGGSGHIIDSNGECTDPPGDNYGILNDTADTSIKITRGQFAGLTQDVFTARAGSNLIGEFFAANDVSWAGTSNGYYFDSGDLIALGGSGITLVNPVNEFSTDGTLGGDSDLAVPTEKAVKTYVDAQPDAVGENLLYDTLTHECSWPEGTTFNDYADDTYGPALWTMLHAGSFPDASGQAGGSSDPFTRYYRCTFDAASQQAGIVQFLQAEDAKALRSATVSLSADLWANAAMNMRMAVIEWAGTADALTSDVVATWNGGSPPTLATNWSFVGTPTTLAATSSRQRFVQEELNIGASINNLAVLIWSFDQQGSADFFNVARVKLEVGLVATEFVPRLEPVEKRLIRNFYQRVGFGGMAGTWLSASEALLYWIFVPEMRSAPTLTLLDSTPEMVGFSPSTGGVVAQFGSSSAITGSGISTKSMWVSINGFSSFTAGFFASVSAGQIGIDMISCNARL